MQHCMVHLWWSPIFDIFETQQAVAQEHRFQTKNSVFFTPLADF